MPTFLSNPSILLAGLILAGLQVLAALPWLYAIDPKSFRRKESALNTLLAVLGGWVVLGGFIALLLGRTDNSGLEVIGKYYYGALLHLQLIVDVFVLMPALLTLALPKTGAVASAAFREGWRQPLFWLITILGIVAIGVSIVVPYFTFHDDYKMMKHIGFDIIMMAPALFGVLAASMSISEEIEGRTAVTLMSKPVNRRQFLVGKYLGALMACLVMALVLGWVLNYALRASREFDRIYNNPDPDPLAFQTHEFDKVVDPLTLDAQRWTLPVFESIVPTPAGKAFARGAGLWFGDSIAHGFGIALGFGQVMILVAIAAALATRLSYIVNLMICLIIFFLGQIAPAIVMVAERTGGGTGGALVGFFGQLFNMLLPALEFFNMGPAVIRDSPLELKQFAIYVVTVLGYSLVYTTIALLVGLLLFEDRDLA